MMLIMMPIFICQVIVPDEKNSMLLGAAMLGMAAGEEEGLEAVVRKLQKISKVKGLKNTNDEKRDATVPISNIGSRHCLQP